jgi:hypothetical protein
MKRLLAVTVCLALLFGCAGVNRRSLTRASCAPG